MQKNDYFLSTPSLLPSSSRFLFNLSISFNSISFFIILAMAAIGMNTDIVRLIRTGGKPLVMGFACWSGIAAVSLIMQKIMGIW